MIQKQPNKIHITLNIHGILTVADKIRKKKSQHQAQPKTEGWFICKHGSQACCSLCTNTCCPRLPILIVNPQFGTSLLWYLQIVFVRRMVLYMCLHWISRIPSLYLLYNEAPTPHTHRMWADSLILYSWSASLNVSANKSYLWLSII
jgi:hypothetical protein